MPTATHDTLQQVLTHARSGNLAEAEKLCEHLLAQATVETEAQHLLGVIRIFRAVALELSLCCDDTRTNLAKPLYAMHRRDEAIAEYRQLICNKPQDAASHASLAFLLPSSNRTAEAQGVAAASLKLDPTNPGMNLARLRAFQEEYAAINPYDLARVRELMSQARFRP